MSGAAIANLGHNSGVGAGSKRRLAASAFLPFWHWIPLFFSLDFHLAMIKGVFLVSAKNAFAPVKRDNSVNIYSRISTVPRGSERSE